MPPDEQDPNIFEEAGGAQPAGDTKPQDDAVTTARLAEAEQRGRATGLQEALDRVGTGRKQDDATQPVALPPLPENPLDLLPKAQRDVVEANKLLDPNAYAEVYSQCMSKLTELRLQRQAAPIVSGQASMIVESFVNRMSNQETRKDLVPKFVSGFHALLVGKDLTPLVGFGPAQREEELSLRWNTAKAQVLENAPPPPAHKPDPLLQGGNSVGTGNLGGPKKSAIEEDPVIAQMAAKYKFTPEQLKEIEAANV